MPVKQRALVKEMKGLKEWDWSKFSWPLALGAALGVLSASLILPGGGDLYDYYLPFADGCFECGYVPYYAQWFLWPLTLLPAYPWTWPLWVFISIVLFFLLIQKTKVNPAFLMLSLPMIAQLWGGQIDVLVAAGLVIFLLSNSPYLRGFGLILALIKPQLSFLALFFVFLQEDRKDMRILLIIPIIVVIGSLTIFGMDWPLEWIRNALTLPVHMRRQASMDIWKYGVFLTWVPLLFKDRFRRMQVSLAVTAIATPFYSMYSYVIFLLFYAPWWAVVLSYAWVLLIPWMGEAANRFAWILPLGVVSKFLYDAWQDMRDGTENSGSLL